MHHGHEFEPIWQTLRHNDEIRVALASWQQMGWHQENPNNAKICKSFYCYLIIMALKSESSVFITSNSKCIFPIPIHSSSLYASQSVLAHFVDLRPKNHPLIPTDPPGWPLLFLAPRKHFVGLGQGVLHPVQQQMMDITKKKEGYEMIRKCCWKWACWAWQCHAASQLEKKTPHFGHSKADTK